VPARIYLLPAMPSPTTPRRIRRDVGHGTHQDKHGFNLRDFGSNEPRRNRSTELTNRLLLQTPAPAAPSSGSSAMTKLRLRDPSRTAAPACDANARSSLERCRAATSRPSNCNHSCPTES
jgi:hypothetical protein